MTEGIAALIARYDAARIKVEESESGEAGALVQAIAFAHYVDASDALKAALAWEVAELHRAERETRRGATVGRENARLLRRPRRPRQERTR